MPAADDAELRARVRHMLKRLNKYTIEREETVMALLDDESPNPHNGAARLGYKMSDGARTRSILDYIGPRLGKTSRMDRELRDSIMLPLREVGVLGITVWDGNDGFIPDWWETKNPNNAYVVRPEVSGLLKFGTDEQFDRNLNLWLADSDVRLLNIANAEAAAAAAAAPGRLVPMTIELYCNVAFEDWEVVYVDDADGARIGAPYEDRVRKLNIPLGLDTRWPDIILHKEGVGFWLVDCVKTDGEIDEVRRDDLDKSFGARGLNLVGMTTAYETFARYAARQKLMKNIAVDTYIWILEEGGSHMFKTAVR